MREEHAGLFAPLRPLVAARDLDDAGYDTAGFRTALSGNGWGALRSGDAWLERNVPPGRLPDGNPGPLPGWWQRPPGAGRADGGGVRPARGRSDSRGPGFDEAVPPQGYAWWYVDGLSNDGRHQITIIAFIGSVFSPYYFWSGRGNPLDHCAVNVAIYGAGGHRWAMTERGEAGVSRDRTSFQVGPSWLSWDGTSLTIWVDEVTCPLPSRIRGRIRLTPTARNDRQFQLDDAGRHVWWPLAPHAEIEVELERPGLSWQGQGYFDINRGSEPLEEGFTRWDWCRAPLSRGATVLYDVTMRNGSKRTLVLRTEPSGRLVEEDVLPKAPLPDTFWRIRRETRADDTDAVRAVRTLEDTPFYARSMLRTRMLGEDVAAMHESLDLDRFRRRSTRCMLPFRMPRVRR
jgi:carotenoid 1,2-hydratase